jgi:hypothetical protein
VKSGKQIVLAAATETQLWKRPEFAVAESAPGFIKSVEADHKPLPAGTAKLVMR